MSRLNVKEKLDWYDALTFDVELTPISVRVAHAIGRYLNQSSGSTFVSHDTLAQKLGVCTKTIERAVRQLEQHGYLSVTRPRGRGRANVYRAITESCLNEFVETPTNLSEKPDKPVQKTRQECLPYPDSLPNKVTQYRRPTAQAADQISPAPSAATQVNERREPAIVGQARQQEAEANRRIDQALAERLTVAGALDGDEVVLNLASRELALLRVKMRDGSLVAADIAKAQADFRAEEAKGLTIVPFPTPENMDFRPMPGIHRQA